LRVFVTGATGFIGRTLALRLRREGHEVLAWVRSEERTRALLGDQVDTLLTSADDDRLAEALSGCDAVVNLAGAPVFGKRWSAARRRELVDSRVGLTERLVGCMAAAASPPRVLVSSSAVGFYGDAGGDRLGEDAPPGAGFLADLCQRWEAAATEAQGAGARVVLLRTGVVLGRGGGALDKMLPPFLVGAGGPIGSGRQYMSWIHLSDLVGIIVHALEDEELSGPVNGAAPRPVTNAEFTKALGRTLRRPAFIPLPGLALKALFGASASVLLESQRALPTALGQGAFTFEFETVERALADLLENPNLHFGSASGATSEDGLEDSASGSSYLKRRKARYALRCKTVIPRPINEVFGFFSEAANLGVMTPADMRFEVLGDPGPMARGLTIDYRIHLGPAPMRWRTLIDRWAPGRSFVDVQVIGPYRCWWHEHRFSQEGPWTVMEDRVLYAPPLGWLGAVANHLFIRWALARIFGYRQDAVAQRFGLVR